MNEDLLYEVKENVGWITLNRESKRNAISLDMIASFLKFFDEADNDNTVKAVCITGVGEKAFCSGADLAGGIISDDPLAGKTVPSYRATPVHFSSRLLWQSSHNQSRSVIRSLKIRSYERCAQWTPSRRRQISHFRCARSATARRSLFQRRERR